MEVTLDLKMLGLGALFICLIVLVIFCIIFVKNLITTVKRTNKILEDTEKISGIAAERTEEVNAVIGDVTESISGIADVIKGNQSIVKALSSIINALGSLRNIINKTKD